MVIPTNPSSVSLWSIGRALGQVIAMLRELIEGQEQIMKTAADIVTAEQAQGVKDDALIALTDRIFTLLSTASPVAQEDPAVQQALDLIAARGVKVDEAIARDTPAADKLPTT